MKFVYDRKFELRILNKLEKDCNPVVFDLFKKQLNQVKISKETAKQQVDFAEKEWRKKIWEVYKNGGDFRQILKMP